MDRVKLGGQGHLCCAGDLIPFWVIHLLSSDRTTNQLNSENKGDNKTLNCCQNNAFLNIILNLNMHSKFDNVFRGRTLHFDMLDFLKTKGLFNSF